MESSVIGSCSICVFCYKTTSTPNYTLGVHKDGTDIHGRVKRFLTVLHRFSNEPGGGEAIVSDINQSKWLGCCKECLVVIDEFCDLYHQMKLLELQLDWRLQRITSSMKLAGRIPARWEKVTQVFKNQAVNQLTEEGHGSKCLANLRRLRQNVVKKCFDRLSKSLPRVRITEKAENGPVPFHDVEMPELRREDEMKTDLCASSPVDTVEMARPSRDTSTDPLLNSSSIRSEGATENFESVFRQLLLVKVEKNVEEQGDQSPPPNLSNFGNVVQVKLELDDHGLGSDSNAGNGDVFATDHGDDSISRQNDNDSSDSESDLEVVLKDENLFGCPKCDKTFNLKGTATYHVKNVHVKPRHKCLLCERVFKTPRELKRHASTVHNRSPRYNHKCSSCPRFFRNRNNLVHHLGRAHGQGTPFPCQTCESVFFTQWNLDVHVRVVHGDPVHKCEECGRGFKSKGKLSDHMAQVHNDEHIYKCLECGNVLQSRGAMKKHALIHQGPSARKYQCPFCEYRCLHAHSLRGHVEKHHKDMQTTPLAQ